MENLDCGIREQAQARISTQREIYNATLEIVPALGKD